MSHRKKIVGTVAGAVACLAAAHALGGPGHGSVRFAADLDGYQEVPVTLNTPASGEFTARIRQDGSAIDYKLTYRNLVGVTQAHIHFARPALTGGIVLWLCNQSAGPPPLPPAQQPPQCQSDAAATSATIEGTLTAAHMVVPVANPGAVNQGITADAAGFADVIDAFRAGAVYANVHTTARPSGEIRGDISGQRGHGHGHGHH